MKKNGIKWFLPAIAMGILLGCLSCSPSPEEKNDDGDPGPILPPALPESIPYDALGGGKLVFERIGPFDDNYNGVYVVDVDARISRGIAYGNATSPQVSPDGTRIAFTKFADLKTLSDIHVMRTDGTQLANVSFLPSQDRQPSWTPDSNQLLFWIEDPPVLPLFRQTAVANPPDRIIIRTFLLELDSPFSVSPDWKLVFLWNPGGGILRIYTANIDGSAVVQVGPEPAGETWFHSPVWSPDGKKIAYLSTEENASRSVFEVLELFIMDADGGNVRSLAKFETNAEGEWSGFNDISVCWSPDGSKLAFNKKEGNLCSHIFLINADGTDLIQITSQPGVTDRSLSWSRY